MRYQKIESKIWNDERFTRLTHSQQLLWFYILTCPHGNLTGCYVLKEGYATADLKITSKDFQKDLAKLLDKDLVKYDYDTEIILVKNFLKHNPLTNPNQKKAAVKILSDLPKSQILKHFLGLIEGLPEGLGEVHPKPETETETETETEENTSAHRKTDAPPKYIFSSQFFDIDQTYFERLQADYPGLNPPILMAEIKKAADWCEDNPKKFKRKSNGKRANVKTFLRNWLDRVIIQPDKKTPGEPKGFAGIREWYHGKGNEPGS